MYTLYYQQSVTDWQRVFLLTSDNSVNVIDQNIQVSTLKDKMLLEILALPQATQAPQNYIHHLLLLLLITTLPN